MNLVTDTRMNKGLRNEQKNVPEINRHSDVSSVTFLSNLQLSSYL